MNEVQVDASTFMSANKLRIRDMAAMLGGFAALAISGFH